MNNKIYNFADGSKYWKCHLIEKGSYLWYLKGFERCLYFGHTVRENRLDLKKI